MNHAVSHKRSIVPGIFGQIKTGAALCGVLLMSACAANDGPLSRDSSHPDLQAGSANGEAARDARLAEAELAWQFGDLARAQAIYLELLDTHPDPAVFRRAAEITVALEDWDRLDALVSGWATDHPDDAMVLQLGVLADLRRGRAEAAAARFQRNYADRLEPAEFWAVASSVLAAAGDPQVAMTAMRELLRLNRASPDFAALESSQLAWRLGLHQRALALAKQAFELAPDRSHGRWLIAVASQLEDHETALEAFATLDAAGLLDPELARRQAELLAGLGRTEEALARLRDLATDPEALYLRGALLADSGQTAEAREVWNQLADLAEADGGTRAAWLTGLLAEMVGIDEQALAWYRRVDVGEEPRARLREAAVLARMGRHEEALSLLDALAVGGDRQLDADRSLLISQLLHESGHPEEALARLNEALAEFPDSTDLLYARAMLAVSLDQLELAEQDLRAIIQLEPDNATALNALGYVLADRTDRYREARRLIEGALALEPDNPSILDSMGWVLYKLGDTDAALDYLERAAVEVHPEIIAHLVEVLMAAERHDEARELAGQHHDLLADDPAYRELLRRLGLQ
ncbi:MAG: tetratricopeptide repeat protein [Wenzhouxiangellaceae bacterium]